MPAARTHALCGAAFLEPCPPCFDIGRSADEPLPVWRDEAPARRKPAGSGHRWELRLLSGSVRRRSRRSGSARDRRVTDPYQVAIEPSVSRRCQHSQRVERGIDKRFIVSG